MFHCLGIEDTNCSSFASKFFVQSRLIQDFRCSAVCDRHCLIVLFMTGHTFSIGDRSGLQVGRSNTFTLSLWNHVVAHAEWELALFYVYASMSIVPSHIFQSPMPFALMHSYTMTDVCFCFCRWWKSGWSLWSLGLRTQNPFFPETSWNVDSCLYSCTAHISTVFLSIWDELWPREPGSIAA